MRAVLLIGYCFNLDKIVCRYYYVDIACIDFMFILFLCEFVLCPVSAVCSCAEFQGCQNSKLQAERISDLQEKKRSLQTLLSSRQKELRQVCLLEAELTGKLPYDFPLEVGEQPPVVQRRAGKALNAMSEVEDNLGQQRQEKTGFSGTLLQSIESDKNTLQNKRTVHRGCHTEETVKSESSSMSDSTHSQDNEDLSSSVVSEHRSLSHPRLASGSPDSRLCKNLSPVEIYYEMRTCHNSASSSVRSDMSSDVALKQWNGSPDIAQFVPLASLESSSSERMSYIFNSLARRSNSSEALLDRSNHPQLVAPLNGMPPRTGPYKSSECLTDGKLRHMYHGSPERQLGGSKEQGHMHSSVNKGCGAGYDETLMDCMSKPQKRPVQSQKHFSVEHIWPDLSALPKSGTSAHCDVFPHSQMHLASATPSYSPIFVQSYQPKPRRVKVTRTKSCGPFTPLQQHSLDHLLVYAYEPTNLLSGSNASSFPNLLPNQTEMPNSTVTFSSKPGPFSLPALDDSTRSLHKALALEGLRDWYLRNALGYPTATRGQDGLRLRPPPHLVRLPWSVPLGPLYSQIPQSTSFHDHPLHGRSVELSLYPKQFTSKETTQKESSSDPPAPGTLV
ncbi:coiled-coil domain-containing protein 120 isoform X2 [Pangasianodon hypophthalmus]|uniref:coiled-coil domain-containing protein 120 isoform X2 n=1 Tax=Pangasianodon hypophthalmus TaxID=310915 RepID=UPI000F00351A|nr:coiled-coil domain-containing protein 120 isoform X2 [Pangasianodon hypophthalmus]